MYFQTHLDADLSRLDKKLAELNSNEMPPSDEIAVLVGEISNSCILVLDKTMNRIWREYGVVRPGKGKANIYFPLNQKSRKSLIQRLSSSQLKSIVEDHHEIFETIDGVQPYNGPNILNFAYELASTRHEQNPEIKESFTESIKTDRSEYAYIKSATNINDKLVVDGYQINEQGHKQDLEVSLEKRLGLIFGKRNLDAVSICNRSIHETKKISKPIFRYLEGSK